jgi:DNA helicase II / ATP-dependent DNA helicase PcrA
MRDDANVGSNETRIWGPPGCGKTTYVSRQVVHAVEKYGGDAVLVTSFTRTAAAELAMRNLPLHKDNVGTLHSHCYRALEYPEIADVKIPEWNREHPEFRLSPTTGDVEEMNQEFATRTHGDELYAKLQILRARMAPQATWPLSVRRFAMAWEGWKKAHGLMDFTDLLEVAMRDFKIAPGNPQVLIADEAQDLTRLQLALVRQWGRHAGHLLLAGDDDQAVLTFAGSDPEALLESDGPAFTRRVLSQSYRVPRVVHRLSQMWIDKLTAREPKEYKPRDEDGHMRLLRRGDYRDPAAIVDDAEHYLAQGKSVMFLTTCAYMLEPLKRVLRQRGVPFFNPYRQKRPDWNPLAPRGRGPSTAERLLSYLRPRAELFSSPWVGEDLRRWASWLRGEGVLREGAMDVIATLGPTTVVSMEMLLDLFVLESLEELVAAISEKPLDQCIHWWLSRVVAKKQKAADYPARVAVRRGVNALLEKPRVIIGTGHSVKGGEADVVYVFPDVSASGMRQWEGSRKDRDAVIRLGYVMVTRARETLVVCEPAGAYHMPLAGFAERARRSGAGA